MIHKLICNRNTGTGKYTNLKIFVSFSCKNSVYQLGATDDDYAVRMILDKFPHLILNQHDQLE